MCGQLKSTHSSRCPIYRVTCSACKIVSHKLVGFCRKFIALIENLTSVPSRNWQSKENDNKKKRKNTSSSSCEGDKPANKVKKVNVTKTSCMTHMSTYPPSISMRWIFLRINPYPWRTYLTKGPPWALWPKSSRLLALLSLPRFFPHTLLPTPGWSAYS